MTTKCEEAPAQVDTDIQIHEHSTHMQRLHVVNQVDLTGFLEESNMIEGILASKDRKRHELVAATTFLLEPVVKPSLLISLAADFESSAKIRSNPGGPPVSVGGFRPVMGGKHVLDTLDDICRRINRREDNAFGIHHVYETLHPFTDCNGRTGRLLWLWHSLRLGKYDPGRTFLTQWYHASFGFIRENT